MIVRAYQQQVDQHTPAQLTDPAFYQEQAQSLAMELARHYHPEASDALTSLTVPEVLAAVRLSVDDLEKWLLSSVPGSRLLTIKQWQMLQSAPTWYRRLQDTAWVASILLNPANIARYLASKLTLDPVTTELQTELLAAIYLHFMRQMGFYLIEMNSGRLRGGADAYRRAFRRRTPRRAREPLCEDCLSASDGRARGPGELRQVEHGECLDRRRAGSRGYTSKDAERLAIQSGSR